MEWLPELSEFLRIKSISADPAHGDDVKRAGEWVCARVREAGGECELVDWHGQPLAIGEIRASDGGDAPTVLCYGHFDVAPPDPLELWKSDPFEPEIRGDYLYGRGTVDDKGPLYMLLAATRELAQAGELPVNVRFCCDGEEETIGHSILEFLEQDTRDADAAIIFDTGMVRRDVPAFNIATRGVISLHVTLRTGDHDLHSGFYGGAALNAAHALIGTLDALIAHDGLLVKPLRAGVVPATEEELAGWATLPAASSQLSAAGARPKDARAAEDFYVRTFAEPTFEVTGIQSGSSMLPKTAIPCEAIANVSLRLAPGQRAEEIAPVVERLLREAAPDGAELHVELLSTAEPALVSPDEKAIRLGLDAFERVLGARPVLIRMGGTLPIVPALTRKGIPALITGFGLPDSQTHSPNERLVAEYVPLGIAAARDLLLAFAEL
jgi:acetylornithine deacetylase/succinyl-diaminopimelate desuccinylase-like protein